MQGVKGYREEGEKGVYSDSSHTVIPEDSGILEDPDFHETEERRNIAVGDFNKVDALR